MLWKNYWTGLGAHGELRFRVIQHVFNQIPGKDFGEKIKALKDKGLVGDKGEVPTEHIPKADRKARKRNTMVSGSMAHHPRICSVLLSNQGRRRWIIIMERKTKPMAVNVRP